MSITGFEKQRLELFAVNGFEGRGTRIVDPDGRMTYAVTRGAGEVPTILIHGGLSNAGEWALCAGGFEGWVIVPDRPGCGLSDPIDYLATDYRAEAVDWMLSLTDALGVDQVDLVGNSMGGYFSIVFALAHPERVRRMVLVGAPAGLNRHVPAFLRLWGTPGIGRLISASPPRDTERIRQQVFGRMLVARPDDLTTEFLQMMANSLALPGAGRASYTMLRTVLNLAGWRSRLRLDADVRALSSPVLFLWGDADAFAPPSVGETLIPRMRDARLEIIERAGHLPHVDAATDVAQWSTHFLRVDLDDENHVADEARDESDRAARTRRPR
jgi:pimeloyl-ACP methyl ester carboxylesterase